MRISLVTIVLLLLFQSAALSQDSDKSNVVQKLESRSKECAALADQLFDWAELGYKETRSATLLKNVLRKNGFDVEAPVAGIPTAFVASYGEGDPVIAILAEYDALPGLSQARRPNREEVQAGGAGHGCGHHLFAGASVGAGLALKDWLKETGRVGTIRVYGTPAEEGGSGKVYMARAGLFEDVDIVLHWHPADNNTTIFADSLANRSAKFRFHGHSTHAAAAPERGRSALDGVEAMNVMANMMREHMPSEARMHYVITRGGEAPNVVPENAEVFYYLRHPEADQVRKLWKRLEAAAEGAAMGTGTEVEVEIIHGNLSLMPNEALAQIVDNNLLQTGGVSYDEAESAFAKELQTSLKDNVKPITAAAQINPLKYRPGRGSTDVGDVSWLVPTAGVRTACWVPGTSGHSWQAVAAGGTSIGHKGMMVAAKVLALTGVDLFKDQALRERAWAELRRRRGDNFRYQPLLGDRKPPLDYRD